MFMRKDGLTLKGVALLPHDIGQHMACIDEKKKMIDGIRG
jgi:hypothetical protein